LYTTIRWNTILRLSNLPKNSSKIISSNRCIITGRKHGINKKFRLSRIALLKLSRSGQISGIKKSV
jgi:small subunit ribosomal protein S14